MLTLAKTKLLTLAIKSLQPRGMKGCHFVCRLSSVQELLSLRAVLARRCLSARRLSTSRPRWRRPEEEAHEVKERLERNILRAGLRLLKGDRAALEENVRQRAVSVDLEKLVPFLVVLKYRELGECVSAVSAAVRVQRSEWTHRDPQTAEKYQHPHPILSEA